jgi:XTP/dITP diphosphohydrolase
MKLLIATTNPGKLAEIRLFLSDAPVTLVSLKDIGITDTVEETGKTFEENAILKARYFFQKSGLPTLADDGGFEIDALGGQPGVQSHRWVHADRESTDEELITYTIERLQNVPEGKRGAQLRLVLALVLSNGEVHTAEASVRGIIPLQPTNKITPGFPYRSLLFLPEIQKYYNYDQLTKEESEKYNHRKRALDQLKQYIMQL